MFWYFKLKFSWLAYFNLHPSIPKNEIVYVTVIVNMEYITKNTVKD